MGVGGERHTPVALPPGQKPGIHDMGGWVSPGASLDGYEKSRPHLDSIPGANRYTDYAIPATHTHTHTHTHTQIYIYIYMFLQSNVKRAE